MRSITLVAGCVAALVVAGAPAASAEPMDGGQAFTKLTRGLANTVTGWVEVPKRIHETSQTSGAFTGFTWGLLRGLGLGFVRTAAGLYEVVTFPYPAPSGYQSVIEPEFVFTTASSGLDY